MTITFRHDFPKRTRYLLSLSMQGSRIQTLSDSGAGWHGAYFTKCLGTTSTPSVPEPALSLRLASCVAEIYGVSLMLREILTRFFSTDAPVDHSRFVTLCGGRKPR